MVSFRSPTLVVINNNKAPIWSLISLKTLMVPHCGKINKPKCNLKSHPHPRFLNYVMFTHFIKDVGVRVFAKDFLPNCGN